MSEKRSFPPETPLQENTLTFNNTRELESYSFDQIDRLERRGVKRRGGKSERGRGEKGVVIYAMLKCYACRFSSRVSFYYSEPPLYVKCQGCGQIYPFDSFSCWCHSNLPV